MLCKPAPTRNRPGKGSVSLDPNYPLVKVLRARPGHEGDQEEGKNGGRELLSKLPTGVTLPMHATPAIVSTQHLPAGSSNSRRRTSLSVFAYFKQKETLPQIWTLLKCLQLQSFVQKWPHDNISERLEAEKFNEWLLFLGGVAGGDKQGRGRG